MGVAGGETATWAIVGRSWAIDDLDCRETMVRKSPRLTQDVDMSEEMELARLEDGLSIDGTAAGSFNTEVDAVGGAVLDVEAEKRPRRTAGCWL